MNPTPARITLDDWRLRFKEMQQGGVLQPFYGGPLERHLQDGDRRLSSLHFDNSPAALRLWNFLLTEEKRLFQARASGKRIIATMKDLGTIPVMVYSMPEAVAFYPDGAWWVPCIEMSNCELAIADRLGIDETFCPVRAMLGAFVNGGHFPRPDLLVCSVGATCDDFSAIAQRLASLGPSNSGPFEILWWEIPARRRPEGDEPAIALPGEAVAPRSQVAFVQSELERIRAALSALAQRPLTDDDLSRGIAAANRVRSLLLQLRRIVYSSDFCPMPALEMLVAEMLAIHYCSDRHETFLVLNDLLSEVSRRVHHGQGLLSPESIRVFWVNPVADLRMMNILEDAGGRLCGTDLLFCHAIDLIPDSMPPMEALAQIALADPMVGPSSDRAMRICREAEAASAEAVIVSRIPGASHCAWEGTVIRDIVQRLLRIPVLEIEVPSISDPLLPALRTRIEALVETAREKRNAARRDH